MSPRRTEVRRRSCRPPRPEPPTVRTSGDSARAAPEDQRKSSNARPPASSPPGSLQRVLVATHSRPSTVYGGQLSLRGPIHLPVYANGDRLLHRRQRGPFPWRLTPPREVPLIPIGRWVIRPAPGRFILLARVGRRPDEPPHPVLHRRLGPRVERFRDRRPRSGRFRDPRGGERFLDEQPRRADLQGTGQAPEGLRVSRRRFHAHAATGSRSWKATAITPATQPAGLQEARRTARRE